MLAYYNEIDPFAAQWLRNLIAAGHIAPGDVDERDIRDVRPDDLKRYRQCHFFAGIGVWSYALRMAGWRDDAEAWTGSCPCQPFSAAGRGEGFADERHLWPHFHWLIAQCRPAKVFGEQVASKDGLSWIDLVQADMEASHYAFGKADLCAAGFGAPHIRQRLYWTADTARVGRRQVGADAFGSTGRGCSERGTAGLAGSGSIDLVDFATGGGWERIGCQSAYRELVQTVEIVDGLAHHHHHHQRHQRNGSARGRRIGLADDVSVGVLADADGGDAGAERKQCGGQQRLVAPDGGIGGVDDTFRDGRRTRRHDDAGHVGIVADAASLDGGTGPTNGFWRAADWLLCRDGKWRPVEPGTFPLVNGASGRVGRLRAYGNAIVAEQAIGFIEACLETVDSDVEK